MVFTENPQYLESSRMDNNVIQMPPYPSFLASQSKFMSGESARVAWTKKLVEENITIDNYNTVCGNTFVKRASIQLDPSDSRQTTLVALVEEGQTHNWKCSTDEHIYIIARSGKIMKIGGTRTGLEKRWNSYKCGHCVPQRNKRGGTPFPGKMSVTNAHLYHTIETDLLNMNHTWEIWSWKLPSITVSVNILGTPITVLAQTYHAYESCCMQKFRQISGHIPQMCDNADPSYHLN